MIASGGQDHHSSCWSPHRASPRAARSLIGWVIMCFQKAFDKMVASLCGQSSRSMQKAAWRYGDVLTLIVAA